jgi:hypothetical protein
MKASLFASLLPTYLKFSVSCQCGTYNLFLFYFILLKYQPINAVISISRYIVLFSFERLIAVKYPLRRLEILTRTRNNRITCVLWITALLLYSCSLYMDNLLADDENDDSVTVCVGYENYSDAYSSFSILSTTLNIIIPLFLIVLANILICTVLISSRKAAFEISAEGGSIRATQCSSEPTYPKKRRNAVVVETNRFRESTRKSKLISLIFHRKQIVLHISTRKEGLILSETVRLQRRQALTRTAHTLLVISVAHLLLNVPIICTFVKSHIFMTGDEKHITTTSEKLGPHDLPPFFSNSTQELIIYDQTREDVNKETSANDKIFQLLALYVFYLNYSINSFLYFITASQYRVFIVSRFSKYILRR